MRLKTLFKTSSLMLVILGLINIWLGVASVKGMGVTVISLIVLAFSGEIEIFLRKKFDRQYVEKDY